MESHSRKSGTETPIAESLRGSVGTTKLLLYTATLLYLSSTASLLAEAQSCGGFLAFCFAPYNHLDGFLSATCKTADGSLVPTSLDLNQHIGNENGKLVDGVGYKYSCDDPGLVIRGSDFSITASCYKADASKGPTTSYDVNLRVSYKDDQLVFNKC